MFDEDSLIGDDPQRLAIKRVRLNTYIFCPMLLTKFNSTHFKNLQYSICFIAIVVGWAVSANLNG
jgi:hypothetical protein